MVFATDKQVDEALRRLGHYRVVRAQEQADLVPGIVGGWVVLALGLRETWGRNIQGGAKQDATGRWVAETDPTRMDVGWLQISRRYHPEALQKMPGVLNGTWSPVVHGKTANDGGYVPRFTDALRFTVAQMEAAITYGRTYGVAEGDLRRFAVAAHNAGTGGAIRGYQKGNVDMFTAGADYSSWVMDARKRVGRWLSAHPTWQYTT